MLPGMNWFFESWSEIIRIGLVGLCAYVALILLLRLTGKRTLSKMNAFDLVVTVAVGSTLASILTSKDLALAEGIAALGLLIFLQYAIAFLAVRLRMFSRLIKAEPRMLLYKGEILHGALKEERVNEDEVLQALRSSGIGSQHEADAVIFETDGSFSVTRASSSGSSGNESALRNVRKTGTPSGHS